MKYRNKLIKVRQRNAVKEKAVDNHEVRLCYEYKRTLVFSPFTCPSLINLLLYFFILYSGLLAKIFLGCFSSTKVFN